MAKLFLIAVMLLGSMDASAQAMRFSLLCETNEPLCDQAIGDGSFDATTPTVLDSFLLDHPQVQTIYFNSKGGVLGAGLDVGLSIRRRGLNTATRPQDVCWSACTYAFLGGVRRQVGGDGVMGVHRTRVSFAINAQMAQTALEEINEPLIQYVRAMGGSAKIIDIANKTPHTNMTVLTLDQSKQLNFDNTAPQPAQWQIHDDEDGRGMSIIQQQAGGDLKLYAQIQPTEAPHRGQIDLLTLGIRDIPGRRDGLAPFVFDRVVLCAYGDERSLLGCAEGPVIKPWQPHPDQELFSYAVASVEHQTLKGLAEKMGASEQSGFLLSFYRGNEQVFLGFLGGRGFEAWGSAQQ